MLCLECTCTKTNFIAYIIFKLIFSIFLLAECDNPERGINGQYV